MTAHRLMGLAGALLLANAALASERIYSNFGVPGPDGMGGGYPFGKQFIFSGSFAVAEPFVPAANYMLDEIRIPFTVRAESPEKQITVELREGEALPGTVLERYSRDLSGFTLINLKSSLHPVLYTGRHYWVVVSTLASGQWGWGGLEHPKGTMAHIARQGFMWVPLPDALLPGLEVSGTPTTEREPGTLFENGGSFPHVIAGAGWQTSFVLVNTGTIPATGTLNFLGDDGSPLSMPVLSSSGRSETASSIVESIPGGSSITITAPDTGTVQSGYAKFTAAGEVGALSVIRYNPSGQEFGMPMETRNANSYLVAFDQAGGLSTAIAIANLAAVSADVTVAIRDESGALLETGKISLPARGHTSFDLADRYAVTKDKQGVIRFDTPEFGSISVLGLRTVLINSGNGFSLAFIPVITR